MKQNDVFLYNFFCSSPLLEEEWRIILEYMKEQDMLECTPDRSAPTFNPAKHGNLCWELKQLYTAITRARNRLQILENAVELSCPLFDYWKKLSCVHARQLDDSLVMAIQTTSTQKEWRCLGIKLYCEGLYDKAEMCFAKARDVHRGTWAKASGLRAAAGHVRALQSDAARESIKKAAKLFGEIGRLDSVVQCLIEAEEYERAGNFFMKGSRKEDADLCFSLAASNKCAVEAYPGNLVEAEGTSRMKRSILREVDLLETADRYKDVSASTPEDRPVTNAEDGKSSQEKLAYPSLPEEPKGDKILLCRVGLRLPDGHRVQRNFLRSDPIQVKSYLSIKFSSMALKNGDYVIFLDCITYWFRLLMNHCLGLVWIAYVINTRMTSFKRISLNEGPCEISLNCISSVPAFFFLPRCSFLLLGQLSKWHYLTVFGFIQIPYLMGRDSKFAV